MTLSPGVSMEAARVAGSAKENIAFIRNRLAISSSQLARMLGVNRKEIVRWEKGRCSPRAFNAVRLYEQARLLRGQS